MNKQVKTPGGCSSSLLSCLSAIIMGFAVLAFAQPAAAQLHGASILKSCIAPSKAGDTLNCTFTITDLDGFEDSIEIVSAQDQISTGSGPVVIDLSNGLSITSVSGSTTCSVGGSLPCVIDYLASVTFNHNVYTIDALDPDPLESQASVQIIDQCNAPGTVGCSQIPNTLQFTAAVDLFNPAVEVIKTGDEVSKVGDEVIYNFTINNLTTNAAGPTPPALVLDSVGDSVLGDLTAAAAAAGCDVLPFGGSCNFSVPYTVQGGDPDPLVNTVTVLYHPENFSNVVEASDSHTVDLKTADFTMDKRCEPLNIPVGQNVTWYVDLTNTGELGLVIDVNDPIGGIVQQVSLAPGASIILDNTQVTGAPGPISNDAVATAIVDPAEGSFTNQVGGQQASATCNVLPPPAIDIEKHTNGVDADNPGEAVVIVAGAPVTWDYIVTNTGQTNIATFTVTDNLLPGGGVGIIDCGTGTGNVWNGTLAPGASVICTAVGTAADLAQGGANTTEECNGYGAQPVYNNIGHVVGVDVFQQPTNEDIDPSRYCNPPAPQLDIEKHTNGVDADNPGEAVVIGPGDPVTWEYIVTNTGPTVITSFTVTDNLLPGGGAGIIDCGTGTGNVWNGTLAPGASVTCTAVGVAENLAQGGANTEEECNGFGVQPVYNNIGHVVGVDEFQIPTNEDTDPSRYCNPPAPQIEIEKHTNGVDADNPGEAVVIAAGDQVTWEYIVTNTGVTVITSFTVTDDLLVDDSIIDCGTGTANVWNGSLAPGASVICTATGTAEDLNVSGANTEEECDQYGVRPVYNNTGHVVGVDEFQIPTNEDTDPSRYCNPPSPDFTINKECTPDPVNAGELITWNIFLDNTGDVPLDIHVTDTTASIDETRTVQPGAQDTITASRIVLESEAGTTIVNTANATADVPGFPTLERTSNTAECEVPPEVELLCRTPGFWGTHACGDKPPVGGPYYGNGSDCEKKNSQNLTQQVLDAINADGQLYICGQPINNTMVDEADSALEAICNSPGNDAEENKDLILARHLTVMAINCEISGANEDCAGVPYLNELFTECNNLCAGLPSTKTFEECGAVDAFNNGRLEGYYCSEDIGQYEGWARTPVPGPAGSSNGCSDATASEQNIFN